MQSNKRKGEYNISLIYRFEMEVNIRTIHTSILSILSKSVLARRVLVAGDWLGDSGALGFDHVSEVARVSEIRIAVRVSVQFAFACVGVRLG